MDRQAVFNTVWTGLKAQDFLRSHGHGVCQYHGSKGRKCAIGHLMQDDEYDPTFEGHRFTDIRSMALGLGTYSVTIHTDLAHKARRFIQRLGIGISNANDTTFLNALQRIHDSSQGAEDMETQFMTFAKLWQLTIPDTHQ